MVRDESERISRFNGWRRKLCKFYGVKWLGSRRWLYWELQKWMGSSCNRRFIRTVQEFLWFSEIVCAGVHNFASGGSFLAILVPIEFELHLSGQKLSYQVILKHSMIMVEEESTVNLSMTSFLNWRQKQKPSQSNLALLSQLILPLSIWPTLLTWSCTR